jgi:hypothetical protein
VPKGCVNPVYVPMVICTYRAAMDSSMRISAGLVSAHFMSRCVRSPTKLAPIAASVANTRNAAVARWNIFAFVGADASQREIRRMPPNASPVTLPASMISVKAIAQMM